MVVFNVESFICLYWKHTITSTWLKKLKYLKLRSHFGLILRTTELNYFMKPSHIIILVAIAISIGALLMYSIDFSTYDTIGSAKKKQGKYVHLIAKLDKSQPVLYDAVKDPNYLSFYAVDSVGGSAKVIYRNAKPAELEQSERVVLKGKMRGEVFECDNILLKCPSKYKDEKNQLEKSVSR